MDREQAVKYLSFSGFSDEQIKAIEGAFTCDKCVYSTSEGCQYDDITETIPPFDDCISKQAVLDSIHANCVYENEYNLTAKHIEDAVKQLPPVSPQKPESECEHDHEILKAYSDGASAVLDKIRAEIEERKKNSGGEPNRDIAFNVCLQIIDRYTKDGE